MTTVALIDDDLAIHELVRTALSEQRVLTAPTAAEGIALVREERPDVVLLDIGLPDGSGLDVLAEIGGVDRRMPVIFITGDDSGESAIEALKLGAYDYLTKPLAVKNLRATVEKAAEARRRMSVEVALDVDDVREAEADALIGRSRGMIEVYRAIARSARQDVPVLIRGESGTGKELVARAVYQHSRRAEQSFLAVNCATLQDNLLETELFGHEKGAFTGADARKIGKFEQCDGGTIFLDEVGDMSPAVQAKMLRLLQQQEFQRLGGTEVIKTDVRIVSATNRPLEEMAESGEFRLDLLHRLNGYEIVLPPLRERGDDIDALVEHFIGVARRELDIDTFDGVAPEALALMRRHDWPGNVRELEAAVRQAVMDLRGPVLIPDFLPETVRMPRSEAVAGEAGDIDAFVQSRIDTSTDLYAEVVEFVEKRLFAVVLERTAGNQSRAAEILGITRGKLRSRIRDFEIDIEDLRSGGAGA